MHANAKQRHEILGHLYDLREAKPKNGLATEYDLKAKFGEVAFALGVLVERPAVIEYYANPNATGDCEHNQPMWGVCSQCKRVSRPLMA